MAPPAVGGSGKQLSSSVQGAVDAAYQWAIVYGKVCVCQEWWRRGGECGGARCSHAGIAGAAPSHPTVSDGGSGTATGTRKASAPIPSRQPGARAVQ
jgi:hypothetical protein